MRTAFYVVALILTIALIVFFIWNIILYSKHIKGSTKSDKDYYELKYQLQFYVAIFTTLIAVFSIFGYDKFNDIEKNVKEEISKKTDSIVKNSTENIKNELATTQKEQFKISLQNERIKEDNIELKNISQKTNDRFNELITQFIYLKKDMILTEVELKSQIKDVQNAGKDLINVKKDIAEINKIDFIKQLFLVTDIYYEETTSKNQTGRKIDTIYFKNLKTISGSNLPKFTKPPSISVSTYKGVQLSIKDVTTEYYTILIFAKAGLGLEENEKRGKTYKYDILIIYKETEK